MAKPENENGALRGGAILSILEPSQDQASAPAAEVDRSIEQAHELAEQIEYAEAIAETANGLTAEAAIAARVGVLAPILRVHAERENYVVDLVSQLDEARAELARARKEADEMLVAKMFAPTDIRSRIAAARDKPAASEIFGGDLMEYLGDDDPGDDVDAWLINGVVAAGVPNLLAGHPKARKTFIAEHMSLCIALGLEWQGLPTKRGRVLLLPREDSVRETKRRIWRLCRGLGHDPRELIGWLEIDTLKPFYWDDAKAFATMRRTIDCLRPCLVVVDSLARSHNGDESSAKDMAIVCNRWSDVCQQTGVAVMMIHHFVKNGSGTLLQKVRGSGAIGATARHLLGVDKPEDPDAPFKFSFDGNLAGQSRPFEVRMIDDVNAAGQPVIRIERAVPSMMAAQTADTRAPSMEVTSDVVNAIADSKERRLSRAKLRTVIGGGRDRADASIAYLKTAGYIDRSKTGEKLEGFVLTAGGEEFFRTGTLPGMLAVPPKGGTTSAISDPTMFARIPPGSARIADVLAFIPDRSGG